MNHDPTLGRRLRHLMAEQDGLQPPALGLSSALERTRLRQPLPRWRAALVEPPMRTPSMVIAGSPLARTALATLMIIALVTLLALVTVAGAALVRAPERDQVRGWSMTMGGPSRDGGGAAGIVGIARVRWRTQLDGPVTSNIALADGLVYVTSGDGALHAIEETTGRRAWTYAPPLGPVTDPVVADGVVYVLDVDRHLLAIDAKSGTLRWRSPETFGSTAPLVVVDGSVLVAAQDGVLRALAAADGTSRWATSLPSGAGDVGGPAVADGVVYVATTGGDLVALNLADGVVRWRAPTPRHDGGAVVAAYGLLYVGDTRPSSGGSLAAFDASDGEPRWRLEEPFMAPAVMGGVVFATMPGTVVALDAETGGERWRTDLEGTFESPAVASGTVYVPSRVPGRIYGLDALTGYVRWQVDADGDIGCCASVADGLVLFGTSFGEVVALAGDETGGDGR